METLAVLLFLAGGIGGIISLITLLVKILRKNNSRNAKIFTLLFGVIFIVSIVIFPSSETKNKSIRRKAEVIANSAQSKSTENPSIETAISENDEEETKESELGSASRNEKTTENIEQETATNDEATVSSDNYEMPIYEYDDLQKLFLDIKETTTETEFKTVLEKIMLPNTTKEYSGSDSITYKIAFNEDVAVQSHAQMGDYIEITFSLKDRSLKYVEYLNYDAWCNGEIDKAVFYVKGTYWDFRDTGMEEDYSGYYGESNDQTRDDGLEIHYTNGNSVKTNFYLFDSAEDLMNCVIDNSKTE